EVTSIEIDPERAEGTRAWSWPRYTKIIDGDALEIVPGLGTFDLIFADAAPFKCERIEMILRALRPRGILAVDGMGGPMSQQPDQAALRAFLSRHPWLQVAELDGSTGVLVAARRQTEP